MLKIYHSQGARSVPYDLCKVRNWVNGVISQP